MKLVTRKEYDNLKADKVERSSPRQVEQSEALPDSPDIVYVFAHPDMIHNGQSGIYKIKLDDEIIDLTIEQGIIRVKSKEASDILKKSGLMFIRQYEVEEDES